MKIYDILLPKYGDDIEFRHITIVGVPASGKTTLALSLGARLEGEAEKRGWNFYCIRAHRLRDVFNFVEANGKIREGALYIIIDDAERFGFSRTKNAIESSINHDYVRHELKHAGFEKGVAIITYIAQRMKNLAPTLRNSQLIIFKAYPLIDSAEYRELKSILGGVGLRYLKRVNYRTLKGDKSWCVIRPTWTFKSFIARIEKTQPKHYSDLCLVRMSLEESYIKTVIELLKSGAFPVVEYKKRKWFMITTDDLKRRGIHISMRDLRPKIEERFEGVRYTRITQNYKRKCALLIPISQEKLKAPLKVRP